MLIADEAKTGKGIRRRKCGKQRDEGVDRDINDGVDVTGVPRFIRENFYIIE